MTAERPAAYGDRDRQKVPLWFCNFDHLATAVIGFDMHCRLEAINVAGETLLSLSRRQILGMSATRLWRRAPHFLAALQRVVSDGVSCRERDVPLRLVSGHHFRVDYAMTPVCVDRCIVALVVEMMPAADPRVTQEDSVTLRAAHDSLRGIAHEIRNPLGGIHGAAQLLEKALHHSSLQEYTEIIIKETHRLRRFLDAVLGGQQGRCVRQMANIHEILAYVIRLVKVASAGRLHVQCDYDPSLPEICLGREQIIQALLNLLLNAWQGVGEQGRVALCTRATWQQTLLGVQHRTVLSVEVRDDGAIIPENIRQRMFYPLVVGRAHGTGLGLAVAQQLVSRHGGLIEYERMSGWNCFRVLLPLSGSRAVQGSGT